MEKIINAIFERISTFFENLKPAIKAVLLILFGLLYGCSYWLSNHSEFKSLRTIMLYLSITIIVLLFIDLNRYLNQKEIIKQDEEKIKNTEKLTASKRKKELSEIKKRLNTLRWAQLAKLKSAVDNNDPFVKAKGVFSSDAEDENLLKTKGFLSSCGDNIYKIPKDVFEMLQKIDFSDYMEY